MGQTMTAGQSAYYSKLQAALPAGFPLRVTSTGRTPAEQAAAMLSKVQKYGPGSLDIYADKATVAKLLALPRDVSAWTAVIEREGSKLSRHLWGGAIDLHVSSLSSSQRAQLVAAAEATGGRALMEEDHLHVDLPAAYAAGSLVQTGAESALKVWLWSAAIGSAALLGLYAYQKYKAPKTQLALRTNRGKLRKNRSLQAQIDEVYWDITAFAPENSVLRLRADELVERASERGATYGTLRQLQEMRELAQRHRRR